MIIAVNFPVEAIGKKKPENIKDSTVLSNRTRDLCENRCYEVTGWNHAEALIFFRLLFRPVAKLEIYCDDSSSFSLLHWPCYFVVEYFIDIPRNLVGN